MLVVVYFYHVDVVNARFSRQCLYPVLKSPNASAVPRLQGSQHAVLTEDMLSGALYHSVSVYVATLVTRQLADV